MLSFTLCALCEGHFIIHVFVIYGIAADSLPLTDKISMSIFQGTTVNFTLRYLKKKLVNWLN